MTRYDAYALIAPNKSSSVNKLGAWKDVKAKGRRLVAEGRCNVIEQTTYSVLAEVKGDTDTYISYVNNNARVNLYENNEMSYWDCTCMWSEWAWTRETFTGRICSHVYAAYLLLQEGRKRNTMSRKQSFYGGMTPSFLQDSFYIQDDTDEWSDEFVAAIDYIAENFSAEEIEDAYENKALNDVYSYAEGQGFEGEELELLIDEANTEAYYRNKTSSVDQSRLALAQEELFKVVSSDIEGFKEYVKNGIAMDSVTDILVKIAVDFKLPVDTLDDMVTKTMQDVLAAQANQLEEELQKVEKDLATQINMLQMESDTISEDIAAEEKQEALVQITQELLQNTPEELLEEMVGNPIPFLVNLGVELPEEDIVALQGMLIQALSPDKEASVKRTSSWIIKTVWEDLLSQYDIEDIKAYFEGKVTPFRDEIFQDVEIYELDAQETEELEELVKEASRPPAKKKAGFQKIAGRFFTEEEKLALIGELGTARQFLAGEIRL